MKVTRLVLSLVISAFVVILAGTSTQAQSEPKPDASKDRSRVEVRKVAEDVLHRLYEAQPLAEAALKNAAGYAVFNNTGGQIFPAANGKGRGVAVNNKSRKETFMKMAETQGGYPMGGTGFSIVFVFDTEKALNSFVDSGWQFRRQSTAAAAMPGAASVSEGVWMYQLTDKGLAPKITETSTRYSKDDDLK